LAGGAGRAHVAQVPVWVGAVGPVVVVSAVVAASVVTPSSHMVLSLWPLDAATLDQIAGILG